MQDYSKKILLSVTGMSPAVVTETLYALVTEKNFIPTEIQVITTIQGKNKLLEALLGIVGGRKEKIGAIEEFIADYGAKYNFEHIHFDESCVTVIADQQGEKLPDIRTPEENELASNQIVKLVGELCQNEDSAIHVSIAGGRKTMGFFLGYALSLYGRKQDSLSHVLVSSEFENVRDFYYPKPYKHFINDVNGRGLDASQGKVMLAEIPWVRLGLGIPDALLNNQISYSQSVSNAQQILEIPTITFVGKMSERQVKLGKNLIKLAPRGYALLLSLVIAKEQQWKFDYNKEEKRIISLYLTVYEVLKGNDLSMQKRLTGKNYELEDLKKVLSESASDINDKVRKAFSLGKSVKVPYIPSAKNACYELMVELADIDCSDIQSELELLI
ncbi:CRISPR-associated ring nuclease Csm6 [Pasteurella sp. P03HT]